MLIRHAVPERDSAACAAIYAPSVYGSATSFETVAPDAAEFARRIHEVTRRYPWLVAEDEGRVTGYAYGTQHRARAAYRWTTEVAVYVDAGHRGRGVGRSLYGALLSLLRRQGLRTAVAGITLPNQASIALHEACGFTHVGVFHRSGFKAGAWHDVGWWELDLAPGDEGPPAEPGPPTRLESG